MNSETVTIAREEYEELKRHKEVDDELIRKLVRSLEDVKAGRIKVWKD
ncbi:MAG: hypothetical protein AABX98_02495 [Nanoarchaeota archaeon]